MKGKVKPCPKTHSMSLRGAQVEKEGRNKKNTGFKNRKKLQSPDNKMSHSFAAITQIQLFL